MGRGIGRAGEPDADTAADADTAPNTAAVAGPGADVVVVGPPGRYLSLSLSLAVEQTPLSSVLAELSAARAARLVVLVACWRVEKSNPLLGNFRSPLRGGWVGVVGK